MLRKNKLKPTNLKLLVSHKLTVPLDATTQEVIELSKTSSFKYFTVIQNQRPVGLIKRIDSSESPQKAGLLQKLQISKTEQATTTPVKDVMITNPLIVEYGTETDLLFEITFARSDERLHEDVILSNENGTYFGNIRSDAIMRLLYGFLGKHMRELSTQQKTLALQHSQVIKVRRDLELTNNKLEFSRDQALEGVRIKSQFLANMSHEIRTPMNGVFGMIDLLYDTNLDSDQESLVTTARNSAETLMHIINDVLDFSKTEAGKISVEKTQFNIVEIVEASASLYAETASEKELNLMVSFEEVQPWVTGDAHRYQQILNNLISNAIKFTDSGTVEIVLTPVETEAGASILTEVIDTGIGIPSSQIRELFRPFTQFDQSQQRKYGGTGLGLSISKNLVDLLGGTLDCESDEENGTIFSLVLPFPPYIEEDATEPPVIVNQTICCNVPSSSNRMDFDGMPVLLVEDNMVNQEVARRILTKLNCQVTATENGQMALEYLANGNFECVFMDCQMPIMDGYEATQAIREGAAEEHSKDVFISAMTAHTMMGEREKCLQIGMDHYFCKPFSLKDFRHTLELALLKKNKDPSIDFKQFRT